MLNPKIVFALAIAAAIAGLTIWALFERSGRLEAKVEIERKNTELQKAVDQVAVLADTVATQTSSIDELGRATARGRVELRQMVDQVGKQHAGTVQLVGRLEASIAGGQAKRADGTAKDCRDAIAEWRAEGAK